LSTLSHPASGHKSRARTPVSPVKQPKLTLLPDLEGGDWHEAVPLADLRPTQAAVGMRAVEAKRCKIERLAGNARKFRRYLERRPVPAVLGPREEYYIIDHHHLSLALWQSEVDEVFVRVVGDLSDLPKTTFLQAMASFGWLHAYDGRGRRICPTRLPSRIDLMQPDRFRDLAWSVREAGGFRKTPAPFSEFAWANFFRAHIPESALKHDFAAAHERAMRLAHSGNARHLPGNIYQSSRSQPPRKCGESAHALAC